MAVRPQALPSAAASGRAVTQRLTLAALLLGALAAWLPALIVRHLPLKDYPQHLLVAQVLLHYDDIDSDYCLHFTRDLRLRPYLGYYGLAWLLGGWLSPDAVARLALGIYLAGTPFAVYGYVRALDPRRTPATLLAFPALPSGLYYLGFINFLMGVPLVFAGLGALLRLRARGSLLSAGAYVLAAAAAYLCHAIDLGMLILASLGVLAAERAPARGRALLLVLGVAALALLLIPWDDPGRGSRLPPHYVPFGETVPPHTEPRGYQFFSPLTSLLYIVAVAATTPSLLDGALWGVAVGAIALAAHSTRKRAKDGAAPRARFVLPLLATMLLFASPACTPSVDLVNIKFLAFMFLSLPALVPGHYLDRRTCAALAIFAALALAIALHTHLVVDREAQGLDEVIARIPRGSSCLPIMFNPGSRALLWIEPLWHAGFLVQARKGGLGPEIWEGPQMPVAIRPEARTGWWRYQAHPWLIHMDRPGPRPDLLLTRGADRFEGLLSSRFRKVFASGSFALWARNAPSAE